MSPCRPADGHFVLQAMAAHNSGGVVIVQVERIVDRRTLPTRNAHIPGAIVDKIVLAPADNHWMHLGSPHYDGSLSGRFHINGSCSGLQAKCLGALGTYMAAVVLPHSVNC